MIKLTRAGTVFSECADEVEQFKSQFAREHCVVLRGFLGPDLLDSIQRGVDQGEFYERIHERIVPPPMDLCMKSNKTTGFLHFLMNDPFLFKAVQSVAGCPAIGSFSGAIFRLVPGLHYDSWHEDVRPHRFVALSLNLSTDIYSGGVLQIRDRDSGQIIYEKANTGFGDAMIFRISPHLQHRVSLVEGAVPRTTYAGFFQSEPDFLTLLKNTSSANRTRVTT